MSKEIEAFDIVSLGLSRHGHQYGESTLFRRWIAATLNPLIDVQDGFLSLLDIDIDNAEGVKLDLIGRIVGAPAAVPNAIAIKGYFGFVGQDDSEDFGEFDDADWGGEWQEIGYPSYNRVLIPMSMQKTIIKAQILKNKSLGTPPEIIAIAKLLLGDVATTAPSVTKVGEYLLGGGGVLALDYAMSQLVGDGIDWVLDPANNRIKYKTAVIYTITDSRLTVTGASPTEVSNNYITTHASLNTPSEYYGIYTFISATTTTATLSFNGWSDVGSSGWITTTVDIVSTVPNFDAHIPIDTVAAAVVANAEAGHAESQEAVKAVAGVGFSYIEDEMIIAIAPLSDLSLFYKELLRLMLPIPMGVGFTVTNNITDDFGFKDQPTTLPMGDTTNPAIGGHWSTYREEIEDTKTGVSV